MCLVSETIEPFIAENDINCYKILLSQNGQYITPYRNFHILFNIEMNDECEEKFTDVFGVRLVESGYFNSCLNKQGIIHVINELKRKLPKGTTVKIFKALIPKGTKYFLGQNNDICSKKLIIYEV